MSNVIVLPGVIPDDELDDDLPIRIEPGEYSAVYLRHQGLRVFQTPKVRADFKVLAVPGLTLSRWYRVSDHRAGRLRAGRKSDLVRELTAVLGTRIRTDRIPLASLKGLEILVEVKDVTHDYNQRSLHELNRYSSIARMIRRAP